MSVQAAAVRKCQPLTDFQTNPPIEIVRHAAINMLRRLPSMIRFEDLYSIGLTALVEASQRFDAARGVEFRTYAKHRVYGAMLDELRSLDTVSRDRRRAIRDGTDSPNALPVPRMVDIAAAADVRDPLPSVDDELDHRRAMQRMREAEATLSPRLQLVLKLRINEGWTLLEIADHLGVTEARVCQMVGEVVHRLRAVMAEAEDAAPSTPSVEPAPVAVLKALPGRRRAGAPQAGA